ncbi:Na+:H+ antiporter, NhaC family [Alteribacillus persepolensis]|uniref:Na+:H+ antiporter, NhaC family n=1 Tax=Alteribacillus persepolensis TaxID=568899 RepID=A0A1G8EWH0_9BACI|nr:Na+/H+ antiporter NhaC [Alteribacillus persepolensis]SDH74200.1 Na+:H+ antiporter, NhaC family [Alteribacillus persepolensis]
MKYRSPSFFMSICLILVITTVLGVSILRFETSPQVPIVIAAIIVAVYGYTLGYKWKDLEKAMVKGISAGIPPILILCMIGIIIGIWTMNGTVPTMAYYGLNLLSPQFFLVSSVILCIIVSVMTGSSWSAISTIGVALMGVSYGMDISPAMTAGAIVCGAVFGDKLSPLSDTTNLASAIGKVDIFEHIRHMLWTTIPALIITLGIFTVIGFNSQLVNPAGSQIEEMIQTLHANFSITMITLLSPLTIVVMALKKFPPIPTLVVSLCIAVLTSFYTVSEVSLSELMATAQNGYAADTGVASIDSLLSIGGLSNMMFGVSIILMALAFGGLVQQIGFQQAVIEGIARFLKRKGNVILTTVLSCIGVNVTIGEAYLSVVLPGQMLESTYQQAGLHRKNLSRTLEDAGTVVHPIIPWGVSGAFIMTTLNIGMEYILFSFICFITPVIAIIYGYTGFSLVHTEVNPVQLEKWEEQEENLSKPANISS